MRRKKKKNRTKQKPNQNPNSARTGKSLEMRLKNMLFRFDMTERDSAAG